MLGLLSHDLLDHLLSALPLQELLAPRLTCHLLHARVQRRFLPVITPPALAELGELSAEDHGRLLIREFGLYRAWLRRWQQLYKEASGAEFNGHADKQKAAQQKMRAQQSVSDGFFSLAPWWRAFGEVVPTPWQPEAWLQTTVHAAAADPAMSAFYQRRIRHDDDDDLFRLFFSTPAELGARGWAQVQTKHIVLAPLNVRMLNEPAHSKLASLPTLSSAMQDNLAVVTELLRAYLPTLRVSIEPMRTHEVDRSMTRGDRQDARTADGKRVRQISSLGLHGARDEIDAAVREEIDAGEDTPFITFVVAPHLYPGDLAGRDFAWCYSTRLDELEAERADEGLEAWVVSTHQIESYLEPGAGQTRSLCNMLLYCVFVEAMELEVCESASCLMNNCDSVAESEEVPSMLCPTCFRKLHLMGVVHDVPECHARVQQVLAQHQLTMAA